MHRLASLSIAITAIMGVACDSAPSPENKGAGGAPVPTSGAFVQTGGAPLQTGGNLVTAAGGTTLATGGNPVTTGGSMMATGGAQSGGTSTGGIAVATGGTTVSTGGARTGGTPTMTGGLRTGGTVITTGGAVVATGGVSSSGVSCTTALPAHTSSTTTSSTISVSGVKDYAMQRFCADPKTLGPGDQSESQKPVFLLAKGATLKNVIIGGVGCSAADGVHCESGSCTLENVWIGDVGEDAITFKGSDASQVMTITGGGAWSASDKVIQHNGPGTIKITGFYFNSVGKGYRSCGNCSENGFARHVELTNVAIAGKKAAIAGINSNYGDTATFKQVNLCGTGSSVCDRYQGVTTGEPSKIGSGADGKNCIYSAADITN